MRLLFFTHYFPPEVNAPANRTFEHAREWTAAGHEVHVVTCTPSHPTGRPFAGYATPWYRYEQIDGVHVHRVWTILAPNRGVVRRVLNYLSFVPTAVFRSLRLGRFDILVGTSPQFFCAVATWIAARLKGAPWVFELRDLWPESIPAVGAMKKTAALSAIERLELKMYRDATAIVCLTKSFIDNLVARGIDRDKMHFVPNGIIVDFWRAGNKQRGRALLNLHENDTVVAYVGTVGMAHGLRTTLQAAQLLQSRRSLVKIVIVGDGAELGSLRADVAALGLTNVQFTGLLPREDIASVLAATDIALVTLKTSEVFRTVLPSKMFEAMAAARPIILAVEGEALTVLERAKAGIGIPSGDAAALASAIEHLSLNPEECSRLGKSGKAFVESEFNRSTWASAYLDVLSATSRRPLARGARPTEPRVQEIE